MGRCEARIRIQARIGITQRGESNCFILCRRQLIHQHAESDYDCLGHCKSRIDQQERVAGVSFIMLNQQPAELLRSRESQIIVTVLPVLASPVFATPIFANPVFANRAPALPAQVFKEFECTLFCFPVAS